MQSPGWFMPSLSKDLPSVCSKPEVTWDTEENTGNKQVRWPSSLSCFDLNVLAGGHSSRKTKEKVKNCKVLSDTTCCEGEKAEGSWANSLGL